MNEIVSCCIDLLKRFTAALREDEVTRGGVGGFNGVFAIGADVFAVMTAEAAVPILVSHKIRISSPINARLRRGIPRLRSE